jgi:hypothetical protein
MKTLRTSSGPFPERPHYTVQELESICADALRGAGCLPGRPEPIRIDRFLEKQFGIVAEYEDLGDEVLGYTRFGSRGPIAVVISRIIDEAGTTTANRRVRTTLAHEAGHILLQGHLFAFAGATASLFPVDGEVTPTQILCRQGAPTDRGPKPGFGYDGRWWEYQANRAIGALLLPRTLVVKALEPQLVAEGSLGLRTLDPGRRAEAQSALAEIFDVNPVVARIRLGELWPSSDEKQFRL